VTGMWTDDRNSLVKRFNAKRPPKVCYGDVRQAEKPPADKFDPNGHVRVVERYDNRDHTKAKLAAKAIREQREAQERARRAEIDRIADAKIDREKRAKQKRLNKNARCKRWKANLIKRRDGPLIAWLQEQKFPMALHLPTYVRTMIPPSVVATVRTKDGRPATFRSLECKVARFLVSQGMRKFGTRLASAARADDKANIWASPDFPHYDEMRRNLLRGKPRRDGKPLLDVLEGQGRATG
jgi:hypothetical protein